jgi:hypothetical protein
MGAQAPLTLIALFLTSQGGVPMADDSGDYPTVSNEPTGNSDLTINREEKSLVLQQCARFGGKCRLFAPMYRRVSAVARPIEKSLFA